MAKKGEETRNPGLGSHVMKGLDLFYLLSCPFRRAKDRCFYLHFTNVKMNTQRSLETWPRLCREQGAEAKLKPGSSHCTFEAL